MDAASVPVHAEVRGDAGEPAREPLGFCQSVEGLVRPKKGLLHDAFRVREAASACVGDGESSAAVAGKEEAEALPVSLPHRGDDLGVACSGQSVWRGRFVPTIALIRIF